MTGPYRMIRAVRAEGDGIGTTSWTPSGGEMGHVGTRPSHVPAFLVVEALAQCAGITLNRSAGERWLLAGIADADVAPIPWDEAVALTATVTGRRQRFATVDVVARDTDGRVVGAAELRMAAFATPGRPS